MQEQDVMNAIAVATEPAEKKKPGRPKKKVIVQPIEVHGIVDKPTNEDDVLELVYCNPGLFKKLIQLYKAYTVSELEMYFDAAGVKIRTRDHLVKSHGYVTLDGGCMNLYYCKSPIRVCVNRDNIEKVWGALGKNHSRITIILKENFRSTMYMIVKDDEYNNDDAYEIDVVFKPEEATRGENLDDDTNYPLRFKLSSKHFKTRVNNIKKLSKVFTIQKVGDEPLQLTFDKAQKVIWTGVYPDAAKICLESRIAPDEVFTTSVCVDHIKPFSNSSIGDDVWIAADRREKISFTTLLDKQPSNKWAACVKVFTEVQDFRRAEAN